MKIQDKRNGNDDDAFRCGSSFAAAAKREMRYGGNGYPRYAHPPRAGSYTGEPVSSRKPLREPKVLPSPRLSSRASLSHSGVLKIGAQGNARSLSPAVSPRANLGQSGAMFVLSLFELCSNFSQALRGPFLVVSTPNFGIE